MFTTVTETAEVQLSAHLRHNSHRVPNVVAAPALNVDPNHSPEFGKNKPQSYSALTPEDVEHFLKHGWLHIPNAIKPEYLAWADDLWTRIGYDERDKSTWHTEYLHLPRHHEVPAEEFAPEAWAKTAEICGGIDMIHPIRERYYGDAFIVNFGSEDKTLESEDAPPQKRTSYHSDCDWHRLFLDSTGNAMTVVHVFSDIPERGGGTWLCEDGLKGEISNTDRELLPISTVTDELRRLSIPLRPTRGSRPSH